MRYPIDHLTVEQLFGHLISHHRAQEDLIKKLNGLLIEAMTNLDEEDNNEFFRDVKLLMKLQHENAMANETRKFNEKNGHGKAHNSDTAAVQQAANLAQKQFNPEENARANEAEKSFGEEMSEEDLARHFSEAPKRKKKGGVDMAAKDPFKEMSLDEIEAWEAKQNNSNDIYKIKARVANLARSGGGSLTSQGEMLCNTFVHVLVDLYQFADTIPDKEMKIKFIERIRKHEGMPGTLINAAGAGVKK